MQLPHSSRRFTLAVLALTLLIALSTPLAAITAQDSGDDPPVDPRLDAAAAYLAALLARDESAATPLMCAADRTTVTSADLADLWHTVTDDPDTLEFPADLEGFVFSPVQAGDEWAQISVSGALAVTVEDAQEPLTVLPGSLGVDVLWVVQENDTWRGCLTAPPDIDLIPGPADIVHEFLDAAFGVDYDRAQATLCAAQRDALSETEFNLLYAQVAAEGVALDFAGTIFTITAWDEDHAEVTLSGTFRLTVPDRPGGITLRVDTLDFAPVPLIFEDGWKICQIAESQVEP
jgi:hypothetical protein